MPRPAIFTRPSKSVLTEMYKTMADKEIALLYGCSTNVVKRWRRTLHIKGIRRHGAGIGAPRQYNRPTKDKLRALTETKTDQEIAVAYGCSRTAVRKWRVSYGLQKTTTVYRRRPWACNLDEDFFEKIDTEQKAYILGLLATDGCVANGKSHSNRVFLSLQAGDEHILQEVLLAMRSTSRIHNRPKGNFPGSGPMKYIAVSSRKLVADLATWGIVPRKSHILTYANVPVRLESHYVRGLFDGDGSLHPKIFYFLGTEALIDGIAAAIKRHTGVVLQKRKAGRLYRCSGYKGSRKVLHWLYEKSTMFLRRKRKIFDEAWVAQ